MKGKRKKGFVVRDVRKYRYRGERSGMLLVEVMVVIFIGCPRPERRGGIPGPAGFPGGLGRL